MLETQNADANEELEKLLKGAKEEADSTDSQPEKTEEESDQEAEPEKEDDSNEYKEKTASRVKKLLDDRKTAEKEAEEARRTAEELKDQFNQLKQELEARKSTETPAQLNVPARYVELFGDNATDIHRIWGEEFNERQKQIEQAVTNALVEKLQKAKDLQDKEREDIESRLDDLSEREKFNRNELMNFMVKKPVYDAEGKLNLELGLELYRSSKSKNNKLDARKEIVNSSNDNVESKPREFFTPNDFR